MRRGECPQALVESEREVEKAVKLATGLPLIFDAVGSLIETTDKWQAFAALSFGYFRSTSAVS